MAPLSLVGLVAPVELIGSVISPTLLSLSMVAGVVTLVIGMTGNIDFSFNWLKESQELELVSPSKFLCHVLLQPEAQNEKVKTFA